MENICLISEFLNVMKGYDKSQETIDKYEMCLKEMKGYIFNCSDFTVENIKSKYAEDYIINWLEVKRKEGLKNSSLNQRISALRTFYKWLQGRQLIIIDISKSIPMYDVSKTAEDIEPLTLGECKELLNYVKDKFALKPNIKTCRDLLLIEIFLGAGLRIDEVSNLKINDFDLENSCLKLTKTKFNKKRATSIPMEIFNVLEIYMNYRNKLDSKVSEDLKEYLFLSQKLTQLSTDQIRRSIYKMYKDLGIENKNIHSLRKSYTTIMINSGADAYEISKQIGHSKIDTTLNIYNKNELKNTSIYNPLFENNEKNKKNNVISVQFA